MSLRNWKDRPAENEVSPVANAKVANPAKVGPPTPSTFATFATFAVAETPKAKPARSPGPWELDKGWRRRLLTDAWHRDWTATWKRGGAPVSADQITDAITRTVNAWNVTTGDRHTTAGYRGQLCPSDYADPELMNRAWLGLYAWTLWHGREAA